MHTRLSVNINKVALLRNSRGSNLPDLVQVAIDCERFGAEGITVHPRPDQRHVRYDDIPLLKEVVQTEFNIEGNPIESFMELVLKNKPHQCTLVPDTPSQLTSDSGWDTIKHASFLKEILARLKEAGIRSSLFMNADLKLIEAAKKCGADRIELYTGPFAEAFAKGDKSAVKTHTEASMLAAELGMGVNAGHDLNLQNLQFYKNNLPELEEVSIGHALISDALYYGLENVIPMYLQRLK